jgi:hypothetical protein
MGVPGVLASETMTNHIAEIEKFLGIEGEAPRTGGSRHFGPSVRPRAPRCAALPPPRGLTLPHPSPPANPTPPHPTPPPQLRACPS